MQPPLLSRACFPPQRLSSGQPFDRIASLDVPARRFGSAEFDLQPGMGVFFGLLLSAESLLARPARLYMMRVVRVYHGN